MNKLADYETSESEAQTTSDESSLIVNRDKGIRKKVTADVDTSTSDSSFTISTSRKGAESSDSCTDFTESELSEVRSEFQNLIVSENNNHGISLRQMLGKSRYERSEEDTEGETVDSNETRSKESESNSDDRAFIASDSSFD